MSAPTALILMGSLCLVMTAAFIYLLLRPSPLSKNPSPTPTSMPSMPLADPVVQVTQMMTRTMEQMMKENREQMETLMLGRPQTAMPSTTFSSEEPTSFDYDSTPLSPGIEATLSREMEEDQQDRLTTERAALQRRLAELQNEEMRLLAQNGSADSLQGPWSLTPDESDNQT